MNETEKFGGLPAASDDTTDDQRDAAIVQRFKRLGSNNQKLGFLYSADAISAAAILNAPCNSGVNPFERGIAQAQLENLAARKRVAEKAREISDRGRA
jgi:hypothetical protein